MSKKSKDKEPLKACEKNVCKKIYGEVNANDPDAVIKRLMAGNRNYLKKQLYCVQQVREPAPKQQPYAAILSCSDSRIIPERIFDTGPGELFVARVAGNVVNEDILASFEFALSALNTNVIIVLGHAGCGAVQAAFDTFCNPVFAATSCGGGYPETECLEKLIWKIRPAVISTRCRGDLDSVIRENARLQAWKFDQSPCIQKTGKKFHLFYGIIDSNKEVSLSKIF